MSSARFHHRDTEASQSYTKKSLTEPAPITFQQLALVTNDACKIPLLVFAKFKVISFVFGDSGWDSFTGPNPVNHCSFGKRFLYISPRSPSFIFIYKLQP